MKVREITDFKIEEKMNIYDIALGLTASDKSDYMAYKYGNLKELTDFRQKEMEVLTILDQLGFPMERSGTYLYKEIVMKAMELLERVKQSRDFLSCRDMLVNMNDAMSQFYFDIARNDLDLGLRSFHNDIKEAFNSINLTIANQAALERLLCGLPEDITTGDLAFVLAAYLTGNYSLHTPDSSGYKIHTITMLRNIPEPAYIRDRIN